MITLWGAIPAAVYLLLAVLLVREDRKRNVGHFINLSGLLTMILVLPVAWVMEKRGHKLQYRSNLQVGAALLVCAALVYLLGAGLGWLIRGPR